MIIDILINNVARRISIKFLAIFLVSYFLISGILAASNIKELNKNISSIHFTENKGQVSDQHYKGRPDVLYYGETNGLSFHLRNNGVSYQLYHIDRWTTLEDQGFNSKSVDRAFPEEISVYRIDMNWKGINNDFWIEKGEDKVGYNNYYLTSCPEGALRVKSYETITYKNIYNGIDLKWYENKGALEYDFIVSPGSDYKVINWEIKGAKEVSINNEGRLIITTPLGDIVSEAPIAYQNEIKISARWILHGDVISFEVDEYNKNQELIIDPVVRKWGTYFGSIGIEYVIDGSTDDSLNVFITGTTGSIHTLATSGSHQSTFGGGTIDAYLAKFNKDGVLKWATYYGGSGQDEGHSCSADGFYNIYLGGQTDSDSSIATQSAHQSLRSGLKDAFLVKFNGNGIRLWATYYGGSGLDLNGACVTDGSFVYLSGSTTSSSSISTPSSHQSVIGGSNDGYLVKFNANGVRQWGTYYGGTDNDGFTGIDVDFSNNVYVTGASASSNSISTSGTHQFIHAGGADAILVKFNSNGVRQWGTYLGGINLDNGQDCSVDNAYNIYITGMTKSPSGIATSNSHQSSIGGPGFDAYLAKFDSSGIRQWSTYYGADTIDKAYSCFSDAASNIYVAGMTLSDSNIATNDAHQTTKGLYHDAFLVKFTDAGTREWATYYGGNGAEWGYYCTGSPQGQIYFGGRTSSWITPPISTLGSHQNFLGGAYDAFLVKFDQCDHVSDTIYPSACVQYHSPSGKFYTESGTYIDSFPKEDGCDSIITIHLTIGNVDTTVTQNGIELSSNSEYATYQWVYCDSNMKPIPGATNKIFTPTMNGSYAVIITQDSCSDTSACYAVTGIGIEENSRNRSIRIHPNPTKDIIEITSTDKIQSIQLYDITGRLLQSHTGLLKNQYSVDIINQKPAMYILRVETTAQIYQERVIKVD